MARIDAFGQFLRIQLHPDRAKVWAIRAKARWTGTRFDVIPELIDCFEVEFERTGGAP